MTGPGPGPCLAPPAGRPPWDLVLLDRDGTAQRAGAHLDRVERCPHDEGTCDCRKPRDGLFRRALAADPWADPRRCAMIGDMPSDVHPARGLGMRGLLLGEDAEDLVAAVDELLSS